MKEEEEEGRGGEETKGEKRKGEEGRREEKEMHTWVCMYKM
jgi:hypothetical protein